MVGKKGQWKDPEELPPETTRCFRKSSCLMGLVKRPHKAPEEVAVWARLGQVPITIKTCLHFKATRQSILAPLCRRSTLPDVKSKSVYHHL